VAHKIVANKCYQSGARIIAICNSIYDVQPFNASYLGSKLETVFLVCGLCIQDQQNGLREVPVLLRVLSFCEVGPRVLKMEQQLGILLALFFLAS